MLISKKIRIYPEGETLVEINKLLGCVRFVYNKCLGMRIDAYKKDGTSLGISTLNKEINRLKKEDDHLWLGEAHSKVIQQSINNLDTAYKNFFRNEFGFPKFKNKHDKNSCRFPVDAIGGVVGNRINLTKKIKNILYKCSVKDEKYINKNRDKIKSATLSKSKSGKYFLSILIDGDLDKKLNMPTSEMVGIDIGIKEFIVTSEDQRFDNLKSIRKNEKRLIRAQRQVSRKAMVDSGRVDKDGKKINQPSNNRAKATRRLATMHETIKNQKQHYLHQTANQLLNENQIIAIETLNIAGMMKNHKLAKSIQELSVSEFIRILEYKARWYWREIVRVDKWFPSTKMCSCCGHKKDMTLGDRVYECHECGLSIDRDLNAAINILVEGKRVYDEMMSEKEVEREKEFIENKNLRLKIGLSEPEFAPVESGNVDDIGVVKDAVLKSTHSMKQEDKSAMTVNER